MKNVNKIYPTFLYERSTIAQIIGVHVNTIRRWEKEGLKSVEDSEMFIGKDVSEFLRKKQKRRKNKLNQFEFYCLRCKSATLSDSSSLSYNSMGRLFLSNQEKILITGKCRECGSIVNRFASNKQLNNFFSFYKVV